MDYRMIEKLLVANRGEIAARIARTAREMGITSVLARAESDHAPAVSRVFDEMVSLGEGAAADTYLSVDRVIDAARESGADAIHPGYGFLSERPELPAACEDAGITFVGPPPEVMERMGSKAEARRFMESVGVPVVPGYDGDDQSIETLAAEAERIGFPLLVKASAGGGGKGMKRVEESERLQAALDSARREAEHAFGDGRLLLERYLENPRHIEFQIFGDDDRVIHLYERDCSVQRRHQKVIEETPAPSLPADLRDSMAEAALTAARGVGYSNAGTVELIMSGEEFYFLEMNTRLQVEHPITEEVVGVDLVRAQLEVAAGGPIPWKQEELSQRGHAIECRIYAEDPWNGYLPQTGKIVRYSEPEGPGVRVDSGVEEGSEIGVSWDPMLAKLVCHAEGREAAIARMSRALREYTILGTITNIDHLAMVLRDESFVSGVYDTHLLSRLEEKTERKVPAEAYAIAAILGRRKASRTSGGEERRSAASVWDIVGSWGR